MRDIWNEAHQYRNTYGHSVGISDSYYRATEHELLDDYLKAVIEYLTLNNEFRLQKKVVISFPLSQDGMYASCHSASLKK